MTRNGSIWMLTAALAFSSLATPARAQQVSEARIRELIKQAQDPASRLQVPSLPSPGGTADNRPVVALTLDDAVKFALDRNLDIAVQRLNPEINDIAYASIKSVYHPSLTSLLSTQSTTNASTTTDVLRTWGCEHSVPDGNGWRGRAPTRVVLRHYATWRGHRLRNRVPDLSWWSL